MTSASNDRYVAAKQAADRLRVGEPTLVRANRAWLYRAGDVALRVEPPNGTNLTALAASASAGGVRTPTPVGGPWHMHGYMVTAWTWVSGHGNQDWVDAGRQLALLHSCSAIPQRTLCAVFAELMRERLDALPRRRPAALDEALDDLQPVLAGSSAPGEVGRFVHGDLHPGNMLWADGAVFIDWELAGEGPALWDLVPMANRVRLFRHDPTHLEDLVAGYGSDPRQHRWFERACAVHAAVLTAGSFDRARRYDTPAAHREAATRFRFWSGGRQPWQAN